MPDIQRLTTQGDTLLVLEADRHSANRVSALRRPAWERASRTLFDVAILGGGVSGACIYHHLSRLG